MQTSSPSKQQLYQLIDQMSDTNANALLAFAHVLEMDPVRRAVLFAPYDDEPGDREEEEPRTQALADPRRVTFDGTVDVLSVRRRDKAYNVSAGTQRSQASSASCTSSDSSLPSSTFRRLSARMVSRFR